MSRFISFSLVIIIVSVVACGVKSTQKTDVQSKSTENPESSLLPEIEIGLLASQCGGGPVPPKELARWSIEWCESVVNFMNSDDEASQYARENFQMCHPEIIDYCERFLGDQLSREETAFRLDLESPVDIVICWVNAVNFGGQPIALSSAQSCDFVLGRDGVYGENRSCNTYSGSSQPYCMEDTREARVSSRGMSEMPTEIFSHFSLLRREGESYCQTLGTSAKMYLPSDYPNCFGSSGDNPGWTDRTGQFCKKMAEVKYDIACPVAP